MAVLKELMPGLDEKLYENALVIELRACGRAREQQRNAERGGRGLAIGHFSRAGWDNDEYWGTMAA
jgi:hypothetical protein